MSHKNGESFKGTFNKWVKNTGLVFSTSLLAMTGFVGNAAAAGYDCNSCCPTVDCCEMPDYAVYADFLYWQVTQDGLEFAQTGVGTTVVDQTARGNIYQPRCHWEPGFRVGLVVDLGCCDWDFYAQYTWLQNKESKTLKPVTGLQPLWSSVGTAETIVGAKAAVDDQFNVLDFGLGRSFRCNECFIFRPHFGFKATWQQLKNDVYYVNTQSSSGGERNHIHNKIEFDGIGLRGGFDGAWRFSPCFSIVGHAALSAVYSDITVTRDDIVENFDATGHTTSVVATFVKTKQNTCVIVPVLELMLGIRWDSRVCDCYDVFVLLGWENQVWFDTSRYIHTAEDTAGSRGNTNWQGLVVRLGMGF